MAKGLWRSASVAATMWAYGETYLRWLTLMFMPAKIGAVLVTINTNYKKHELEYLVKQSDMHTLAIVDGLRDVSYIDVLYELVPELKTMARELSERTVPPPQERHLPGAGKAARNVYLDGTLQLGDFQSDEMLAKAKKASTTTTWSICSTRQAQPASRKA